MNDIFSWQAGATALDFEDMEGLKIPHISTRQELDRWEQKNITKAYYWLKKRRQPEFFSELFVRTLHKQMFADVWSWAGAYRHSNKNLGIDWAMVPAAVQALLDDTRYWIEHGTYSQDEIGARFHYRLVAIHPFVNGNGRHARLMTDVLLEEKLSSKPFSWSIKDMPPERSRIIYVAALKAADENDYRPLLEFLTNDR